MTTYPRALAVLLVPLLVALAACRMSTPSPVPPPGSDASSGGRGSVDIDRAGTGGQVEKPACRAIETVRAARDRRAKPGRVLPRIVGGQPSPAGKWPAAVALEEPDGWQFCGACLIDPSWILTAAHCELAPGEVAVLGKLDLRLGGGETIPVDRVLTHELYQDPTKGHDVALGHLSRPSTAPPVALVPPGWTGAGTKATAIGWGLTSEGAPSTSPILREVPLPIWTAEKCAGAYPGLSATDLCAGLEQGGADTCQGDSGGPLLVMIGDAWRVAGLTSWGDGCARPGLPGVYTAVARVRDFIDACAAP